MVDVVWVLLGCIGACAVVLTVTLCASIMQAMTGSTVADDGARVTKRHVQAIQAMIWNALRKDEDGLFQQRGSRRSRVRRHQQHRYRYEDDDDDLEV